MGQLKSAESAVSRTAEPESYDIDELSRPQFCAVCVYRKESTSQLSKL